MEKSNLSSGYGNCWNIWIIIRATIYVFSNSSIIFGWLLFGSTKQRWTQYITMIIDTKLSKSQPLPNLMIHGIWYKCCAHIYLVLLPDHDIDVAKACLIKISLLRQ